MEFYYFATFQMTAAVGMEIPMGIFMGVGMESVWELWSIYSMEIFDRCETE